jgi:integrase/recombinase XerD
VWDDYDLSKKSQKQKESPDSDRIQPLTKSEVNALCENVPAPRVRNELLIRLMAQTGMRAHEAAMLRIDDVDRDSREITVRSNKTEETRTVAYQPSVAVLFSEWLDGVQRDAFAKHPDSEYLFVKRSSDDHVDENWINEMVVETAKEAGIQDVLYTDYAGSDRYKVTSHQLRHTFGIHAIDPDVGGGSMNLRYLQEMMGHSDLETTEKYLKYVEDKALTDMKRHGPTY